MNTEDQRLLEQLYILHMHEVEKAQPRTQVRLEANIDAHKRVTGKVYPAPKTPDLLE